MLKANPLERRLQVAGVILILGLVVQAFCLFSHGAVGFLVFTGAGSLILLGVLLYLLALVRSESQEKKP